MKPELERLNRMLGEVARRNDIEGLTLNHDCTGGLQLKNGARLLLEYAHTKGRLYLYTPLMTIPPDESRRMHLYEAMLTCNFLNLGGDGGTLAMFRHTWEAVYQVGLEVSDLSADRLEQAMNALIDQRPLVLYQLNLAKDEALAPVQPDSSDSSTFRRLTMRLPGIR